MNILERSINYSKRVHDSINSVDPDQLEKAYELIKNTHLSSASIYVCGNGGSLSISEHFYCDHSKGALFDTGSRTFIEPLTSGPMITAIANDIGYEDIFSYQLKMKIGSFDTLVVISASGNSPNIIKALNTAKDFGAKSIAFVGFDGGKAKEIADVVLHCKEDNYGIIEDSHQALMHILAQQFRMDHLKTGHEIKL